MEFFNNKKYVGIVVLSIIISCVVTESCKRDEKITLARTESSKSSDENIIITLQNGEKIILEDTVTYRLTIDNFHLDDSLSIDDIFTPITRDASDTFRAYGFDSQEPQSELKKYLIDNSLNKYGIASGYYIARYINVHKNLPILPLTSIMTANYNTPNAPTNAMGWYVYTTTLGFNVIPVDDYNADGITQVFYIHSNFAGVVYDTYIPANPSNFIWAYKLIDNEDVW